MEAKVNLQVLAEGLELVILLNTLLNFRAFKSVINEDRFMNFFGNLYEHNK